MSWESVAKRMKHAVRALFAIGSEKTVMTKPETLETSVVVVAGNEHILLIQREGIAWALPGGALGVGERFEEAARRTLQQETGILSGATFIPVGVFDDPKRVPDVRTINHAFLVVLAGSPPTLRVGADTARAQWFQMQSLPALAADHRLIIERALPLIKPMRKQLYIVIVYHIIPQQGAPLTRFTEAYSVEEAEEIVRRVEQVRDGDECQARLYDPERDGKIREGQFIP
jgi:ADP-ribose pyrophosphatase YjhB (NUDIX family)